LHAVIDDHSSFHRGVYICRIIKYPAADWTGSIGGVF
jgi:hypothetical protein